MGGSGELYINYHNRAQGVAHEVNDDLRPDLDLVKQRRACKTGHMHTQWSGGVVADQKGDLDLIHQGKAAIHSETLMRHVSAVDISNVGRAC